MALGFSYFDIHHYKKCQKKLNQPLYIEMISIWLKSLNNIKFYRVCFKYFEKWYLAFIKI